MLYLCWTLECLNFSSKTTRNYWTRVPNINIISVTSAVRLFGNSICTHATHSPFCAAALCRRWPRLPNMYLIYADGFSVCDCLVCALKISQIQFNSTCNACYSSWSGRTEKYNWFGFWFFFSCHLRIRDEIVQWMNSTQNHMQCIFGFGWSFMPFCMVWAIRYAYTTFEWLLVSVSK